MVHKKTGQASLEAVIVLPLIILTLFTVILSSMTFFNLKADVTQLNYELGRIASMQGSCDLSAVTVNGSLAKILNNVYVAEGKTVYIYKANSSGVYGAPLELKPSVKDPSKSILSVWCPYAWIKGTTFRVGTRATVTINSPFYLFPREYASNYKFLAEFGQ